jgi:hypothetical protein
MIEIADGLDERHRQQAGRIDSEALPTIIPSRALAQLLLRPHHGEGALTPS